MKATVRNVSYGLPQRPSGFTCAVYTHSVIYHPSSPGLITIESVFAAYRYRIKCIRAKREERIPRTLSLLGGGDPIRIVSVR